MSPENINAQIAMSRNARKIRNAKSALYAGGTAFNGLVAATESGFIQKVAIFATVVSGYVTLTHLAESSHQSGMIEAYENVLGRNNQDSQIIYDYESELTEK